ncbi:peptide/nickel transport system ATP-binding protein [Roseateles sp. YR242]|uniref:ABC transporter ATP-binding protein n=1 Tax=Roseateles sp. YR242 TaxID=1855305 RepID=UPI0008D42649|nr:ABC transporter ATP-binding protein [Roseateles sp. YR242]SEK80696.1 peptide/nickel transport system ATP-binding protein [Roseateles sp. YR242]
MSHLASSASPASDQHPGAAPPAAPQPLLRVRDLRVSLPGPGGTRLHALHGLDLDLDRGDSLALIGESGSGKTLTALAIMGLLPDGAEAGGRIELDGQPLLSLDEPGWCALRGRRIAMVFQEPLTALNPLQTILAQVAEPIRLHRLAPDRDGAHARAMALLTRVGLDDRQAKAFPHQLSGGQRQRALIAMALAGDPDLLMADEPTTALDARLRVQVLDLLHELVAERGMGLLLISHDLALTARRARRLAILYGGRLMEQGDAADLLHHPRHPYTQALWAARPRLGAGRDQALHALPGAVPSLAQVGAGCPFAPRCPLARQPRCGSEPPLWNGRVACWELGS